MKLVDLTGEKFGKLVVIEQAENVGRRTAWLCRCECGNQKVVVSHRLISGCTRSCGCLGMKNRRTHGMHGTRIYKTWISMKRRCANKNDKRYGGRGITVCPEWRDSFEAFYEWAIKNGYDESLTIDRINNDGNYEPDNCRWVDWFTQANNKRDTAWMTYNGKTQSVTQWAREFGILPATLWWRFRNGWTPEECLNGRTKDNDYPRFERRSHRGKRAGLRCAENGGASGL